MRRVTICLALLLAVGSQVASATQPSMHPPVTLLDESGRPVLESAGPVSPMTTCGECHDTAYIESHSSHSDLGAKGATAVGEAPSGRPWDFSSGPFGRFDPLAYRYLSPAGAPLVDLGTADWVRTQGAWHVGGGPAVRSQEGRHLTQLETRDDADPETHVLDPRSGEEVSWSWTESGVVELNCFLCHIERPDNAARISTLDRGEFRWAATATLAGSGLVEKVDDGWRWHAESFDSAGRVAAQELGLGPPTSRNCGQCHGLVHTGAEPVARTAECRGEDRTTASRGEIFSAQRISDSGMNIRGKDQLGRAWDVHAERVLECTECHFSLNSPIYHQESSATKPAHLKFDGRRMPLSEYLRRPSHELSRGHGSVGGGASDLRGSMRGCESCHRPEAGHEWLAYPERHFAVLACESCHIPRLYAPAIRQADWTVVSPGGTGEVSCRGTGEGGGGFEELIEGFEPVLLPRSDADGLPRLGPYNLVSSWFWVYGDPPVPVPRSDLEALFLAEEGGYRPEIVSLFDRDGDGLLASKEVRIDTLVLRETIERMLEARGLSSARIVGEIQPYGIHHDVATGSFAVRECRACHSADSRIAASFELASYVPGGVLPELVGDAQASLAGRTRVDPSGRLVFEPSTALSKHYVLGYDSVWWARFAGLLLLSAVVLAVAIHAALRVRAGQPPPEAGAETRQLVLMYSTYERLWHWLQALAILLLFATGLEVLFPDSVELLGFDRAVAAHNILGFLLVINAALAAFFHLASGEIRQYLPAPHGFFGQAIAQARYYLFGIFRGQPHPFEKIPGRKLNRLQQITYLAILNVLLPLQMLTGVAMWGAQRWPEAQARFGGLSVLAPVHEVGAWLFAAFLVAHVYLTTTGRTPTANLRAMIAGWEEIEIEERKGE